MRKALIVFLVMISSIACGIFGAAQLVLIGLGKKEDPIWHIKKKSNFALIRGIIGLVILVPSFIAVIVFFIVVIRLEK